MHISHIKFTLVLMVVGIPFAAAQIKLPPAASRKVDYKQDIQPLLSQNCYSCHGPRFSRPACGLTCARMPCAAAITAPSSKSVTAPPAS